MLGPGSDKSDKSENPNPGATIAASHDLSDPISAVHLCEGRPWLLLGTCTGNVLLLPAVDEPAAPVVVAQGLDEGVRGLFFAGDTLYAAVGDLCVVSAAVDADTLSVGALRRQDYSWDHAYGMCPHAMVLLRGLTAFVCVPGKSHLRIVSCFGSPPPSGEEDSGPEQEVAAVQVPRAGALVHADERVVVWTEPSATSMVVRVFDREAGRVAANFVLDAHQRVAVAGDMLVAVRGARVAFHNVSNGNLEAAVTAPAEVEALATHGALVAAVCRDGRAAVWAASSGEETGAGRVAGGVDFSLELPYVAHFDGRRLAFTDDEGAKVVSF